MLNANQLRIPDDLVYFEAPSAGRVLILNPDSGAYTTLTSKAFAQLRTYRPGDDATLTDEVHATLRQLVLKRVVYYGNYAPAFHVSPSNVPYSLYWETTHGCSLRCEYCYMSADTVLPGELTTQQAASMIRQAAAVGVKRFVFTGGEAMIRKDLYELARLARSEGLTTEIITNATLIRTLDDAIQLKEHFDYIITSLDGDCPESNDVHRGRGSYEKIVHGMRLLKEVGVSVSINSTISEFNVDRVQQLMKFVQANFLVQQHRIINVAFLGRGNTGSIPYDWQTYKKTHEYIQDLRRDPQLEAEPGQVMQTPKKAFTPRKNCGMGSGEIYVDAQGKVYPCKLITTPDWFSGNIKEQSLAEILNAEALERARTMDVDNRRGCRTCMIRRLCGGGCRGMHMGHSGDANTNDPQFCWVLRHQTVLGLWMTEQLPEALDEPGAYLARLVPDDRVWTPEIGTALPNDEIAHIVTHLEQLKPAQLTML